MQKTERRKANTRDKRGHLSKKKRERAIHEFKILVQLHWRRVKNKWKYQVDGSDMALSDFKKTTQPEHKETG